MFITKHCVKQSVKQFKEENSLERAKNGLTMRKPGFKGLVSAWLSENRLLLLYNFVTCETKYKIKTSFLRRF